MKNLSKEKRKSGRPLITDSFVTLEQIIECYQRNKSMRKTAAELGIGVMTVFTYINKYSKPIRSGQMLEENLLERMQKSPIGLAIEKLPKPLPRSCKRISALLKGEFNYDAVRHFLKGRAVELERQLRERGSLLDKTNASFRDIHGRVINVGMIAMYFMKVDMYNQVVTIDATLKFGGKVTIRIIPSALIAILEGTFPKRDNAPQI